MKKLLTLTVLVAGVILFAGCMNKPTEEVKEETTPTVEVTTQEQINSEVVPADETISTTESTGGVEEVTAPTVE